MHEMLPPEDCGENASVSRINPERSTQRILRRIVCIEQVAKDVNVVDVEEAAAPVGGVDVTDLSVTISWIA